MDQQQTRSCPACGIDYVFKGRKKVAAEAAQSAAVETRYLCKACGNAWKEKVPVKEAG